MKSIYLVRRGSPDRAFEIREQDDPAPGQGEVRIRVEASGLNFADVLARLGVYPEAPPLPFVPGYDVAGQVDRVGPGVDALREGDRVVAFTRFGGYASHVLADSKNAVPLPDGMDAARATALAAQYCTAWYAAEEAVRLHDGDHVLIHAAAGGVGTALVQLAKRRGCVVFGTAGSDAKLDLMRQNGVDHPINYRAADFAAEVRRLRGGRGLDAVFDSVGGQTFRKSLPLLEAGGRMVFMGIAQMAGRRPSVFRALKTLVDFGLHSPVTWLKRSQSLIGVNMLQIADRQPEILQRCMQGVMELAGRGEIHPRVGRSFPFDRVAEAHEFLGMRQSTGKVVLLWPA